jgi:two-component system invasion response regulator UvrY
MGKISVMVVDDHSLLREAWGVLLSQHEEFEMAGDAGDSETAIEMIRNRRPDVIMLDISIKPKDGFEMVKHILHASPNSKVLALSMHSLPAYAKKMLQLGAKGYVTKNTSIEEVVRALIQVSQGKNYVCREIVEITATLSSADDTLEHDINILTEREVKIVKCVSQGMSSREISEALHISNRTVEVHRHRILKKLNFKNTPSLINFINYTNADL